MAQLRLQHKNRFSRNYDSKIDFLSFLWNRSQIRGCQSLVAQKRMPYCSSGFMNDPTESHDISPVGNLHRDADILFDEKNAHALCPQAAQHVENVLYDFGRETCRGLIKDQKIGLQQQGSRDSHHLLLTSAKQVNSRIPPLRNDRKQIADPLPRELEIGRAMSLPILFGQSQILLHGQVAEQPPILQQYS